MAEQFLDGTNVVSAFKQVSSKAVAKSVATGGFPDARPSNGRFDGVLQVFLCDVVTA